MLVIKITHIYIIISYILFSSSGLQNPDEDIILEAEAIIRNTTNHLFSELKFENNGTKLWQSFLIHNFFTNVSLMDHNTFKLIVTLSRFDNNNVSELSSFILNKILNVYRNQTELNSNKESNNGPIQNNGELLNETKKINESNGQIIDGLSSNNNKQNVSRPQHNAKKFENDNFIGHDEFWAPEPERRIYKGEIATIKNFPFIASIHIYNRFQCAGSIIKSNLVITAASCLQLVSDNMFYRKNPAFLSIRVGSSFFNTKGEKIYVRKIYYHPDYEPANLKNNIAILKLRRHLKLKKNKLEKIEVDTKRTRLSDLTKGFTIVGWGAKRPGNILVDLWSTRLHSAVLDLYDHEECQIIYSREYITRKNFCAGFVSKGSGACGRDVGDPGILNGVLIGVVSFGAPVCGTPDTPTVFTMVGYYADWIKKIMKQDSSNTKKRTTQPLYLRISRNKTTSPPPLMQPRPGPLSFPISIDFPSKEIPVSTENGSKVLTKPLSISKVLKKRIIDDLQSRMYNQFMNFLFR